MDLGILDSLGESMYRTLDRSFWQSITDAIDIF
jgi:hypothetical protein